MLELSIIIFGIVLCLVVFYPVARYSYFKYFKVKETGLIAFISGYPHEHRQFSLLVNNKEIFITDIIDRRSIHDQICESLQLCKENTIIAVLKNNMKESIRYSCNVGYNSDLHEVVLQDNFKFNYHPKIISEITELFELNDYDLKIAHGWIGGCISPNGEIFHYKQHKYDQKYHAFPDVNSYNFVFDIYIIKLDNIDISHHTVFLFENINTSSVEYILPEQKQ